MPEDGSTARPLANAYCFSSLLLLREEDWERVHPSDVETVRQAYPGGWQLLCFRYRGREGAYDVLDDGERSIRVRDAVVKPVPEPQYKHAQRVYAVRKQAHGVVRRIVWNWKREEPYYLLDVNGKPSGFWYYDGDLEPERAAER